MKKILFTRLSLYIIIILTMSCVNETDTAMYSTSLDSENSSLLVSYGNVVLRINEEAFKQINDNRVNDISSGDSYIINNAKRKGDFIEINLSYSGGCLPHNFEIIWDGLVYTDEPSHMNLLLIHKESEDSCEALITETLVVDLKKLVGDVIYKDSCEYRIFSTYNSTDLADVVVESIN
ncbi:hypothetical protein [uncultured Lutibacter sp.]|uniref:hypothetical protein n=1 Tax=uncultured Lutibacter sp. TaxID=437739 RepID=UPI00262EFC11|nr:hypothetical protein [uncultured Lutibacter sp.]